MFKLILKLICNLKIHFLCLKPFLKMFFFCVYWDRFPVSAYNTLRKFYSYIADRLASSNYCFSAQYIKLRCRFIFAFEPKKATFSWKLFSDYTITLSICMHPAQIYPSVLNPGVSWKRSQSIWTEIGAITEKLPKPLAHQEACCAPTWRLDQFTGA